MTFAEFSKYAWFADLAYVKWEESSNSSNNQYNGTTNDMILAANQAERAPEELAYKIFSDLNYSVDSFQKNTGSGFAASLYSNGNEKILAIRGTEPTDQGGIDLLEADLRDIGQRGLALYQAIDMINYIMQLQGDEDNNTIAQLKVNSALVEINSPPPDSYLYKTAVTGTVNRYYWLEVENNGQGLGEIQGSEKVVLSGHSLGGHLAALAQRIFPDLFDETFTYNAAGFDPATSDKLTNIFVEQVAALLPEATHGSFSNVASRLHTLESESSGPGDDISLVASNITGNPASTEIYIATEKNSHSMSQFSDDLNVQALFEKLLPNDLTLEDKRIILTQLMESASNVEGATNEILLGSLSTLLQTQNQDPVKPGEASANRFSPPDWEARISLHERLIELENRLNESQYQNLQLEVIGNLSASDIENKARATTEQGLAFRYALVSLNPFAIIGAEYAKFNKNGELDLYTSSTPDGQLSDKYLQDRANFLVQLLYENINDTGAKNPYDPINIDVYPNLPAYYYADLATGKQSLNAVYSDLEAKKGNYQQYIFGSNEGDSDIAGGSKDDHLYGMGGNDTIKGHGGDDYIEGGKGQDTMDGGSGKDIFAIVGEDEAYDIFNGGDGEDTIQGSKYNDIIRIHEFEGENRVEKIDGGEGDCNILAGTGQSDILDLTETTISRIHRIEMGAQNDTIRLSADSVTNIGSDVVLDGGEGSEDAIKGSDGADILNLAGMNIINFERIDLGGGDDMVYLSSSENGPKFINGGSEKDNINGVAAGRELVLEGGDGEDHLIGGRYDDTLYGGSKDLVEDNDRDTLNGGAGNDIYHIGSGDIIEDSDMIGSVRFNGQDLSSFSLIQTAEGSKTYKSADGKYTAIKDAENNLEISTLVDGTRKAFTIRDFTAESALGITLQQYEPPVMDDNDIWTGTEGEDVMVVARQDSDPSLFNIFMYYNDYYDIQHRIIGVGNAPQMKIDGKGGDDYLFGFANRDEISGGIGNDLIMGHMGYTTLDSTTYVVFPGETIIGDVLSGSIGNDGIFGSLAADVLDGGENDDILSGYNGDDTILGGTGRDILFGSQGNDALEGGDGNDALYGYGAHQNLSFNDLVSVHL